MTAAHARRMAQLALGCTTMGIGVALLLEARLGMDPYGVLLQGLAAHTRFTFGTVNAVFGILLVLVCWWPGSVRPGLGTVLQPVLVGLAVDVATLIVPGPTTLAGRSVMAAAALIVLGVGAGSYLGANMGSGPFESVSFALRHRWRRAPFGLLYAATLGAALLVGVAIGGTMGVATVVSVLVLGPLVSRVRAVTMLAPQELQAPNSGGS